MILKCVQTMRLPRREISFTDRFDQPVGEAIVPKIFIADMNIFDEHYRIETETTTETNIIQNNTIVGNIFQDIVITKKVLFIKSGYAYERYSIHGKNYSVYETGLGADQHYFSLYEDDKVIAVIHKADRVVNYKDTYTLYASDRRAMISACIYTIYLEATSYVDTSSGLGNMVSDIPTYTQKELCDKFDPKFISRIMEMND